MISNLNTDRVPVDVLGIEKKKTKINRLLTETRADMKHIILCAQRIKPHQYFFALN